MITISAVDGGLATFGLTTIRTDGAVIECIDADTFSTVPMTTKRELLSVDRMRRARELAGWLEGKMVTLDPNMLAGEAMSFPRGHNTVVCIALAAGVVAAVLESRGLDMATALPMKWRKVLVAGGNEEKAHAVAIARVPSYKAFDARIPDKMRAHARDALGVAVWSLSTTAVQWMIRKSNPAQCQCTCCMSAVHPPFIVVCTCRGRGVCIHPMEYGGKP